MDIMEIVLLLAGVSIFALSFFLPAGLERRSKEEERLLRKEIRELVTAEMDAVKGHIDDVVDETVGYAMEKTERALERLSNEKIMAVNEYSDTVLAEIHKNHEEAMFLYDMLNNKHTSLKNTVSEMDRTVKQAEAAAASIRAKTPEPEQTAAGAKPKRTTKKQTQTKKSAQAGQPAAAAPGENGAAAAGMSAEDIEAAIALGNISVGSPLQEDAGGKEGSAEGGAEKSSKEEILAMYREGEDAVAIAKKLGLGVGEVKLVIDLFKNQRQEEENK